MSRGKSIALASLGLLFAGCLVGNVDVNPALDSTNAAGVGGSLGGASGSAGTSGASGSAGTSGAGGIATVACTTETKGATCTNAGASCYKTCGPEGVGKKNETCTNGSYQEGTCRFDYADTTVNWSCYSLTGAPACAAGVQMNAACTVGTCKPCTGTYLDATGTSRMGNCVCNTSMKWACALDTAWPMVP